MSIATSPQDPLAGGVKSTPTRPSTLAGGAGLSRERSPGSWQRLLTLTETGKRWLRTSAGGRVWIFFLTAFVVLSLALIPFILLPPAQNSQSVTNSWGTFSLSPTDIYNPGNLQFYPTLNLTAILNVPFNGTVTIYQLNGSSSPPSPAESIESFAQSASSYFTRTLHASWLRHGTDPLAVALNGSVAAIFLVTVNTDPGIPWLDVGALAVPVLFAMGVWLAPVRPRWMLFGSVPLFIIAAAFFGQRYDMFFMLSSGVRSLHQVNPFVPSSALPAYLKWIYPPLYVPYSELSGLFYHYGLGLPLPANTALNYPGASQGDPYSAWKTFAPPQLPAYYLILKLPMIAATLGTYFLLARKFRVPGAEKLWLLNPFVVLIGAAWGQLDVLAVACMGLSLWCLQKNDTLTASTFAAVGGAIKFFPALLLPFILIQSRRKGRDLLPIAGVVALSLGIYWAAGSVTGALGILIGTNAQPTALGTFFASGLSWQILLPVTQFPPLLLYVFGPFYLYQIWSFARTHRNIVPILIELFLVFYLTYNMVNSQYFIYIVFLFLVAKDGRSALIFSLLPAVYLWLTQSLTYFVNPSLSYWYFSSPVGQAEQMQVVAVAHAHLVWVLALAATAIYLWRLLRSEGIHAIGRDLRRALRLQRPGEAGTHRT